MFVVYVWCVLIVRVMVSMVIYRLLVLVVNIMLMMV